MRRTRWLLLAAILAIVGGLLVTYRAQKRLLQEDAPKPPVALSLDLNSSAEDWTFEQHDGDRPIVRVTARSVAQVKDSSRTELEKV